MPITGKFLRKIGLRILHFPNQQVSHNLDETLTAVLEACQPAEEFAPPQ